MAPCETTTPGEAAAPAAIRKAYRPWAVILHGSAGRGDPNPADIDCIVVQAGRRSRRRFVALPELPAHDIELVSTQSIRALARHPHRYPHYLLGELVKFHNSRVVWARWPNRLTDLIEPLRHPPASTWAMLATFHLGVLLRTTAGRDHPDGPAIVDELPRACLNVAAAIAGTAPDSFRTKRVWRPLLEGAPTPTRSLQRFLDEPPTSIDAVLAACGAEVARLSHHLEAIHYREQEECLAALHAAGFDTADVMISAKTR